MASNDVIAAERTLLLELLNRLIMPGLRKSQEGDKELGFSSGYLARMWPAQVLNDLGMARLMRRHHDFAMPLTAQAKVQLSPATATHFTSNVQEPMMDAVIATFDKHGTRWLQFPLLLATGADTALRNLFWRGYLRLCKIPVTVSAFTHGTPPAAPSTVYMQLIEMALDLRCPEKLAETCYAIRILDEQAHLLGQPAATWFEEFSLLALMAKHRAELQTWLSRWPLSADAMPEIKAVAQRTSPSMPSRDSEPHLWKWFATYLFVMPVNNVLAERQFNIANIYVSPNESELSKQASHLFVENVLHSTASRLELYSSLSASSRKSVRVTSEVMEHVSQQMIEYAAIVTPQRVKEAREQVKRLRSGESTARTSTAAETYSTLSSRHRLRPAPAHDERMAQLEDEGRRHGVVHDPGSRRTAAVQERAATRSFPPTREEEPGTST